jgi:peptidyl-prolyl cis-trans isomerase A (cyclophilin A)
MRSPIFAAVWGPVLLSFGCAGSSVEPAAPNAEPAPVVTIVALQRPSTPQPPVLDADEPPPPTTSWSPGAPIPDAWLHPETATETAPDEFTATFQTTKGVFVIRVHRGWAPHGADRFYNLVRIGYYTDIAFFRAIDGFMVQFGIHGEPRVNTAWREARLPDDPSRETNREGTITFANSGPGSRTVQLFLNTTDNGRLDGMGFAPFGEVIEGMRVVHDLHAGYGEGAPAGKGPSQAELQSKGNAYLREQFPKLDYIESVRLGM